jgi:hypothetical protein
VATDPELDAIEARAEAATPGPWTVEHEREFDETTGTGWTFPYELVGPKPVADVREPWRITEVQELCDADAEFIAAARSDVPGVGGGGPSVARGRGTGAGGGGPAVCSR